LNNVASMPYLYVKDNGTDIYNDFLSAGSNTVTLGITAGNTIEVGFGMGAWESNTTMTNYAMAVAPEPLSSTLFIIGGATIGFRMYRKKKMV